jgi:hypothetical protein
MRGSSNTNVIGASTVVETLECVQTDGDKATKQASTRTWVKRRVVG